jgi:hypothetical protein
MNSLRQRKSTGAFDSRSKRYATDVEHWRGIDEHRGGPRPSWNRISIVEATGKINIDWRTQ